MWLESHMFPLIIAQVAGVKPKSMINAGMKVSLVRFPDLDSIAD